MTEVGEQTTGGTAAARLASGEAWRDLLAGLERAGQRLSSMEVPDTPQMRALAHRHLLRLLRAGEELLLEYADAERPVLHRTFDLGLAFALDNPDTLYHRFPVLPGRTYRLRAAAPGKGKPPHFISVSGMVFEREGLPRMGADLNNANGSLRRDSGGGFDLLIGGNRAAENWLPIEAGFSRQLVLLRQTFADWEEERPLELELERAGEPAPLDLLSPEVVAAALERIGAFVEFHAERWVRNTLEARERGVNVLPAPKETPEIAGLTRQLYAQGFYSVPTGQALVVTFGPPPACAYWGVQLANWLGESLDYARRRVSINSHQAVLDRDGKFRAVLAAEDPGVPNWLDIGGGDVFTAGLVIARFTECGDARRLDAPQTRLLPLGRVWEVLPPDHPHVSAAQRRREMRLRRRHLAHRLGQ